MTVDHSYDSFHLIMHSYLCTIVEGKLTLMEHAASCWLEVDQLEKLDFAEADIPILKKLVADYK